MFGQKTDKPAPSGMEIMLRSMGLGEVLDMAKKLAEDGTLAKILAYADSAEKILAALERVEHELKRISPDHRVAGEPGPEPGSGSSDGGPVIASLRSGGEPAFPGTGARPFDTTRRGRNGAALSGPGDTGPGYENATG